MRVGRVFVASVGIVILITFLCVAAVMGTLHFLSVAIPMSSVNYSPGSTLVDGYKLVFDYDAGYRIVKRYETDRGEGWTEVWFAENGDAQPLSISVTNERWIVGEYRSKAGKHMVFCIDAETGMCTNATSLTGLRDKHPQLVVEPQALTPVGMR